jgi:hypothetical protein
MLRGGELMTIYTDDAVLQSVDKTLLPTNIVRNDVRRQAELEAISPAEHVGFIGERDDRRDGSERSSCRTAASGTSASTVGA